MSGNTSNNELGRRDAERFIEALAGTVDAEVTFQTFADHDGGKQCAPSILHGSIAEHWDALAALNEHGHGIFVMVNAGDLKGRTKANVVGLRALFIDDDGKGAQPVVFTEVGVAPFTSLAPSWSVESSPGKWHHYFGLKPGEPVDQFTPAQAALAQRFNTDPAVKDISRVMRLPGFFHRKNPSSPFLVRFVQARPERYTIKEVCGAYAPPTATDSPSKQTASNVASDRRDRLERARLYVAKVPPAIAGQGGDKTTFALCCTLARGFDLTDDEVLEVLQSWNLQCEPPWGDDELLKKVQNAREYGTEEIGARLRGSSGSKKEPKPNLTTLCDILADDDARAVACGRAGKLEMDQRTREMYLGRKRFGSDTDVTAVRERIARHLTNGYVFTKETTYDALALVASQNMFNPVKEYLVGLKWDGVERLNQLQEAVLRVEAADRKPIADVLLRKWFISAVARALDPGCKVDTVLILVGGQGMKKSTFFSTLGGDWFTDSPIEIGDKDAMIIMGQKWLIEWAELDSMLRARNQTTVKAFISQRDDTYRPPYGRTTVTQPRCSIIVGTTNEDDFLTDPTGNRRFWPVAVGDTLDIELLKSWRDQLWAEAVVAYRAGEQWWLNEEQEQELEGERTQYERQDAWLGPIAEYLVGKSEVRVEEILTEVFLYPEGAIRRGEQMRVAACLKALKWKQSPNRRGAKKLRYYVPGPGAAQEPAVSSPGTPAGDSRSKDTAQTPPPAVPAAKSALVPSSASTVHEATGQPPFDEDSAIRGFMAQFEDKQSAA